MTLPKKIMLGFSLFALLAVLNRYVDAENAKHSTAKEKQGMVKIQFVESNKVKAQKQVVLRPERLNAANNFRPNLLQPPEPPDEQPPVQKKEESIKPSDAEEARKKDLASLKPATNKDVVLSNISLSIGMKRREAKIDVPDDRAAIEFAKHGEFRYASGYPKGELSRSYGLATSSFCHRPLYFEELGLERHGHNWGVLTPAVSAMHFYGTIPILPYKMAIATQRDCVYEGSLYRPGSPAMYENNWPPLRVGPGAVEAAVITGLIFAIP